MTTSVGLEILFGKFTMYDHDIFLMTHEQCRVAKGFIFNVEIFAFMNTYNENRPVGQHWSANGKFPVCVIVIFSPMSNARGEQLGSQKGMSSSLPFFVFGVPDGRHAVEQILKHWLLYFGLTVFVYGSYYNDF